MALCTLYMELISIYEDNNVIDIYYIKLTCIVIQQTLFYKVNNNTSIVW